MRTMMKSALCTLTLGSAVVALAACGSYYRTGYAYSSPAYVYEPASTYVVPSPGYVVTNPPTTIVTQPSSTVVAQTFNDDCGAIYRPAYCSYPRFGGTVMINGVAYTGLHFRDGRFGREFYLDGAWHRLG
jgi:hypothetical protein